MPQWLPLPLIFTHANTHTHTHTHTLNISGMALKLYHGNTLLRTPLAFNSPMHPCKSLTSVLICPCDTSSHSHFCNDNLGVRSPRDRSDFYPAVLQGDPFNLCVNNPLLPPFSSPKLALLPCLAIPPLVFTVAISNLATLREVASMPHSSHAASLFAFRPTWG